MRITRSVTAVPLDRVLTSLGQEARAIVVGGLRYAAMLYILIYIVQYFVHEFHDGWRDQEFR